jgi:hypothetical protein
LITEGLLSFLLWREATLATFHSQSVFELEVTMFWGYMGCARYLHLPGACVDVVILLPLMPLWVTAFASVYPVWTNAMNEFVISKAGV